MTRIEGVLLPQVPVEEKWDRQQFLEETCAKAGMRAGCWKDENTDIFQFTAVVFGDTQSQTLTPETSLPPGLPARPGSSQERRRQVYRRTEPCRFREAEHGDEVSAQQQSAGTATE